MQRSMIIISSVNYKQQKKWWHALIAKDYREKEFDMMEATKKIDVETMIPFDSSAMNKWNPVILHRMNSLSFEMGTITVEMLSSSSSCWWGLLLAISSTSISTMKSRCCSLLFQGSE